VAPAEEKPAPKSTATVAEKKALEWSAALVKAIDSGQGATELVDWSCLMARCSKGLDAPPKTVSSFQKGMEEAAASPSGLFGQIHKEISQGGGYKYMRTFNDAEGMRIKFRFLPSAGGVNFHDYLLKEEKGQLRAVDIKIAATGEDFSQSMRRFFIPMAAKENQGLLQKLVAKENALLKQAGNLEAMAKAIQENHPEQVAPIAAKMPADVRNEKFCLLLEMKAAQMVPDDKAHQEVIERFRRLYPQDAAIDLLSMDYFVIKDDLPEALACAERFQKSMGEEAFMQTMIADLQWQNGKIKESRATISKAIQMEPDFVNARWTLVTIADSEKDFATVNKTLQQLVTDFGAELDPEMMRTEPFYKEFVKSPEFGNLVKFLKSQPAESGK